MPGTVLGYLNVLKILTTSWLLPPFYSWGMEAWQGYVTCQDFTTSVGPGIQTQVFLTPKPAADYWLICLIEDNWMKRLMNKWKNEWMDLTNHTFYSLILTTSGKILRGNRLEFVMKSMGGRIIDFCVRQLGPLKKIKPKCSLTSFFNQLNWHAANVRWQRFTVL